MRTRLPLLCLFPAVLVAHASAQGSGDIVNTPVPTGQQYLFLRALFPSCPNCQSPTPLAVNQSLANTVKSTMNAISHQATIQSISVQDITMPTCICNYIEMGNASITQFVVDMYQYATNNPLGWDRAVIFVPKTWSVGGKGYGSFNYHAAVMSNTYVPTIIHELGHTYGWEHANFWWVSSSCSQCGPFSPTWTEKNYGDEYCIMGDQNCGSRNLHQFAPWYQVRAGWLSGPNVQVINGTGVYDIQALEDTPSASVPSCLRVPRDEQTDLFFYWKREGEMPDQVLCSLSGDSNACRSILMDVDPGTGSSCTEVLDAGFTPGATLSDPQTGFQIQFVGFTAGGLARFLVPSTAVVPAFADQNPVVDITANQAGLVSGSVTFTVSAFDPNATESGVSGLGISNVEMGLYKPNDDVVANGLNATVYPTGLPATELALAQQEAYLNIAHGGGAAQFNWTVNSTGLANGQKLLIVDVTDTTGRHTVVTFQHVVKN